MLLIKLSSLSSVGSGSYFYGNCESVFLIHGFFSPQVLSQYLTFVLCSACREKANLPINYSVCFKIGACLSFANAPHLSRSGPILALLDRPIIPLLINLPAKCCCVIEPMYALSQRNPTDGAAWWRRSLSPLLFLYVLIINHSSLKGEIHFITTSVCTTSMPTVWPLCPPTCPSLSLPAGGSPWVWSCWE